MPSLLLFFSEGSLLQDMLRPDETWREASIEVTEKRQSSDSSSDSDLIQMLRDKSAESTRGGACGFNGENDPQQNG